MYRSALALFAALACAAPLGAQTQATPDDGLVIPLSRARQAGAGAHVVVDGFVSVPPGVFDGGFAIQDRTAGIWVLPLGDNVLLRLGQRVRIRGTLDNPNGQLAIQPSTLQLFETIAPRDQRRPEPEPEARTLRTGAIDEDEEGWLVRIRGRVAGAPTDDSPWGWKVTVDDGSGPVMVFIDAETDVDATRFRAGEMVEVTGFAGQYDDHYEVVPRTQADVRPVPPS